MKPKLIHYSSYNMELRRQGSLYNRFLHKLGVHDKDAQEHDRLDISL